MEIKNGESTGAASAAAAAVVVVVTVVVVVVAVVDGRRWSLGRKRLHCEVISKVVKAY